MYKRQGGFRGPLRSLTTKNKQNANEADRKVNDFRCKLTTCKWHGLHAQENSPDAACMYGIENTERKSNETSYYCEIGNLAKSFALPISCWVVKYFCWPGSIRFLGSFWEHGELHKCSTTRWLSPTLSACLHCRALIGAYLLCCFVQGWFNFDVLCCACGRCSTTCSYVEKQTHKNKKWNKTLLKKGWKSEKAHR